MFLCLVRLRMTLVGASDLQDCVVTDGLLQDPDELAVALPLE